MKQLLLQAIELKQNLLQMIIEMEMKKCEI